MWQIGERQQVTEHDRLWLAVSLFWGLGCENALFNVLTHAGCVVLQEHFDAGEALALIERERCTLFYGTPNMAQALHEHPDRARRDLSSLRGGATIGTPEQIMRVVELGAREVCNIYGLTETYGNCNVTDAADPLEKRLASVGRPLAGVDQRIVDPETGRRAPARRGGRGPGEGLRDAAATTRTRRAPPNRSTSTGTSGPAISASSTPTAASTSADASRRWSRPAGSTSRRSRWRRC